MRRTVVTSRSRGFTLVEMLTVIVIVGVILPTIAAIMINTYQTAQIANARVSATMQMKQALNFMESDVKLATSFDATVPSQFSDPYGPNNQGTSGAQAWSYQGNGAGQRVLITSNLATTENPSATGRQLVYENAPNSGFDCGAQNIHYEPVLTYATIYFLQGTTLWRRILTDTTTPLCPANSQEQRQSCPPSLASSWNSICEANDEMIATGIASFDVQYFSLNGSNPSIPVQPNYSSTAVGALADADYVIVTLTSQSVGKTTFTMSQQITKVNQP